MEFFPEIGKGDPSGIFQNTPFTSSWSFKANYDVFPVKKANLRSGETNIYLSVFACYQQFYRDFQVEYQNIWFKGFGFKARVQLFKKYPRIGNLSLEFEYSRQCSQPYYNDQRILAVSQAISLVYGFNK